MLKTPAAQAPVALYPLESFVQVFQATALRVLTEHAPTALAGGMGYAAVGQAVSRFARRLEHDSTLPKTITNLCPKLSNVET